MTIRRKRLMNVIALTCVAVVMVIQAAVGRSGIERCFDQVKAAINAGNYGEAYALTTPAYQASNSLEEFTAYEGWRGDVRDEPIEVSAWFRTIRINNRDNGTHGFWRMSFDRIDGNWRYCGDRTAYVEKF